MKIALTLTAAALSILLGGADARAASGTPSLTLTSEQRRRMYELLREYTNTKKDPDRRAEVVDELVALGPVAASQLLSRVDREVRMKHPRYTMAFERAAMKVAADREKEIDKKQLEEDLAALKRLEGNPTKADAEKSGWPAMLRLKALYTMDPADVLAADEKLADVREELVRFGTWADACRGPVLETLRAQGRDTSSVDVGLMSFAERLTMEESGAATRAFSIARKHAPILKANAPLLGQVDKETAIGIRDLNLMRMIMGHAPLRIDLKLCTAAHDHSEDMRTRNFFDHVSPVPGKRNVGDRAKMAGTTASGENIYRGKDRALDANLGWFHSPGHFTNMFRPSFKRIGIGHSGGFWTQVFG